MDPTRNALIARAEDASDEKDAVRLAELANNRSTREVYVPEEPYRTLRSLTRYDHTLADPVTAAKNALKALCRRWTGREYDDGRVSVPDQGVDRRVRG